MMLFFPKFLICILLILSPTGYSRIWGQSSPCPRKIKTLIPGYSRHFGEDEPDEPVFETMAQVHQTLKACPDIESLDLRVTLLGCSSWPDRFSFPFSLWGGESYPPLTTVRLEGYDFDHREYDETRLRREWSYLPWYERLADWLLSGNAARRLMFYHGLNATQRDKTNLELWRDAMDWSKVQELALDDDHRGNYSHFFDTMAPHLASLERLELAGGHPNLTTQFLHDIAAEAGASLTHFTWTALPSCAPREIVPVLVASPHSSTLRHLDLHAVESLYRSSPVFEPADIVALAALPNLTHLSLNLPRNGTWPLETLTALASLPHLTNLTLHLDITSECRRQDPEPSRHYDPQPAEIMLSDDTNTTTFDNRPPPCTGAAQFMTPFLNASTALEAFRHLRAHKVGAPLMNLTLFAGDWSRPWDGPLYFPPWIEGRKAEVECRVVEDGRASGDGPWEVDGDLACQVQTGARYWESRSRYSYW